MRRIGTKLWLVMALIVTAGVLAATALAGNGPQKKIWVCHFAGNTAPTAWTIPGAELTGDYVLGYVPGGPTDGQVAYCIDHGGLGVLTISAAAALNEKGHQGIQLTDRIALYP